MTVPWLRQAQELRAQGWEYRQIGRELKHSHVAVWNALNPEKARANRRRRRARRKALNRRNKNSEASK